MQKTITLFMSLLCIAITSRAINVSGLITTNTTWTKANSPYIVTGQLAIDSAIVLTIEPGVVVKFDTACNLTCYGKIVAEGTATDTIRFTAKKAVTGYWGNINFGNEYTAESSSFKYCIIEYGTSIATSGPEIHIDHSIVRYTLDGVYIDHVNNCSVTSCLITHNDYNGINAFADSGTVISSNEISHSGAGINTHTMSANILISYNTIHDNGYGVYADVVDGHVEIYGNTIYSCKVAGLKLAGDPKASNFEVYNNQVTNSWTGVDILSIRGRMAHNGIYNNNNNVEYNDDNSLTFENNCMYDAWHQNMVFKQSVDVVLPNNYWGAKDSLSIDSTITDYYDNFTSGKVKFWPFLSSADSGCHTVVIPPPPTLGVNKQVMKTPDANVYPNPANDVLNIDFTAAVKDARVMITDMTGKLVYQTTINSQKQAISISQWPAGVYLLKYSTADHAGTVKLVKQ